MIDLFTIEPTGDELAIARAKLEKAAEWLKENPPGITFDGLPDPLQIEVNRCQSEVTRIETARLAKAKGAL